MSEIEADQSEGIISYAESVVQSLPFMLAAVHEGISYSCDVFEEVFARTDGQEEILVLMLEARYIGSGFILAKEKDSCIRDASRSFAKAVALRDKESIATATKDLAGIFTTHAVEWEAWLSRVAKTLDMPSFGYIVCKFGKTRRVEYATGLNSFASTSKRLRRYADVFMHLSDLLGGI